jgi:ABC-type branched-subunit amino acid transport system permease subunit
MRLKMVRKLKDWWGNREHWQKFILVLVVFGALLSFISGFFVFSLQPTPCSIETVQISPDSPRCVDYPPNVEVNLGGGGYCLNEAEYRQEMQLCVPSIFFYPVGILIGDLQADGHIEYSAGFQSLIQYLSLYGALMGLVIGILVMRITSRGRKHEK